MLQKTFLISAVLIGVSMPASAQVADDYSAISAKLSAKAELALSAGDAIAAQADFERALVADPANVGAMIGLGKSHEAVGRTGKGLRYYRLALDMEPNYIPALEAQALAFIKAGFADRASANLTILERLCPETCSARESVAKAINMHTTKLAENTVLDSVKDSKEQ